MNDIRSVLGGHRIIPVVVIDDAVDAAALGDALVSAGLPLAEITFRTAEAEAALNVLAHDQGLIVGAGSVRTAEQVERAVDAGARFVFSPGFSGSVVERCRELGVPTVPGVATATEIMQALDVGIDVVKLFPAGTLGGPALVRDLSAPFPSLHFVPTGGVGPANLTEYLSLSSVIAVGGSWMVSRDLLRAGRFEEIRSLAADAVAAASECDG